MPTRYGRSPWVDQFPKSRLPAYQKYRGPSSAEVVVIGGGLTGCATAYAFAAAGIKVVLLEADRIGRGASAAATGWIGEEPGPDFLDVEKRLGLRAARHVWQTWRRSALDFAALVRRLDLKAQLTAAPSIRTAAWADDVVRLTREQKARRAAGLDASLLNARAISSEVGTDAKAGLRLKDGSLIDPFRATIGLAAAAVERGAAIFESSAATKVTFTRKHADVHLEGGSIRTTRVIVTTGVPTPLYRSLIRHFWFKDRFAVLTEPIPAKLRQRLGTRKAVILDAAAPPHVIRWVDDRLLVSGADSDVVAPRLVDKTLVQRTGQLMYELSTIYPDISGLMPEYGWRLPYALTGEGLPYVGPHRNFPHHLFVFGDASHGVTVAYLASRLLLRHHLGDAAPIDEAFGFNR
jgi:glycine/D-amino acid oxidase-like deaminating enzyme